MSIAYPIFVFLFVIWLSYYKYQETGGFIENDSNYIKSQQAYEKKWKERDKIRTDKEKKEKQLDEVKKLKDYEKKDDSTKEN